MTGRMTKPAVAVCALTLTFSACSPGPAKADQPGPDWIPARQVIEQTLASGYSQVFKLEADDGHWEGEGIKHGRKMDFHADPRTGVITSEKPDR